MMKEDLNKVPPHRKQARLDKKKSQDAGRIEGKERFILDDEIRALTRMYTLSLRRRAKNPEKSADVDKTQEDSNESMGDHIAMSIYLLHYFLPLLEERDVKLDYESTLDMVLAHEIAEVSDRTHVISNQKTPDIQEAEIDAAGIEFSRLPKRNGFNVKMYKAYDEYLGSESSESHFVRAIKGLETMLYIASKPPAVRNTLLKDAGYTIADYRRRIGQFCDEFPPLNEFYSRIERVFIRKGHFAEKSSYKNESMTPEAKRKILSKYASENTLDDSSINIESENEGILRLYVLNRKLRFGKDAKPKNEHFDTDTEHIAGMLFLARYFIPILKSDPAQKRRDDLSLREIIEIILAHDAPEALTGDKITGIKTHADTLQEIQAAISIAQDYAPRAGRFNMRFAAAYADYEFSKTPPPGGQLTPGNATLAKMIDILQGQFNIIDPQTREKLPLMQYLPHSEVSKKLDAYVALYPASEPYVKNLEVMFKRAELW